MASAAPRIDARRRALYAKIEIAKKQLGLDDEAYRGLMARLFDGKRSRTALNIHELISLVEHFKSQGFKATPPKRGRGDNRPAADSREHRKMRALWISLWHLGCVQDSGEAALSAFARRVTGGKDKGVADLAWVRAEDAYKVIEALKAWAARPVETGGGGVDWSAYDIVSGGIMTRQDYPRARVIEAQWRLLCGLRVMHRLEGLDKWVQLTVGELRRMGVLNLTPAQSDRVIAMLGTKIRKARPAAGGAA